MDLKSEANTKGFFYQVKYNLEDFWSNLSDSQQVILKKIWMILTYKWQWQLILNAPFLLIWILDQTIPAVHSFDMELISSLPIPMEIKTLLGFS
tara:strand:+ start:950 stop:1231 length:282 start_codon:yes stop_codon:yes gene_type:complete